MLTLVYREEGRGGVTHLGVVVDLAQMPTEIVAPDALQ